MSERALPFELRIRRMTMADVDAVYALDVLSFTLPWPSRSYRFEVNENPNSRPWVAEVLLPDGRWLLAAMTVIWVIIDEGHVGTFAVHPDFRRMGIGRRMMGVALQGLIAEGIEMVFLEVRRGNLAAQALYRQFGFEVEGVRSRYYQDNHEDALLMSLRDLKPEKIQHLLE